MSDVLNVAAAHTAMASPIGRWLNFSAERHETGLVYALRFDERHIGNPGIRAIHGGVVSAFLELAAQCELAARLEGAAISTTVVSVDFMASTAAADMKARASIERLGRRIAFISAHAWQRSEDRPAAAARICLRIGDLVEKSGPGP